MTQHPRRRRTIAKPDEALGAPPRRDRLPPPSEAAGTRRRWPALGTWVVLLAGAQLGRWTIALPEGLSDTAGLLIALGLAVTAALAYRRWARRAMERARTRDGRPDEP